MFRFTVFENAPVYIFSPYLAFNNCVLSSSSLSEEGEEDIRLLFVSLFLVVFTAFDDDVEIGERDADFCCFWLVLFCCCCVNATPPKNRPREQCSWRRNTPTLKSPLLLMLIWFDNALFDSFLFFFVVFLSRATSALFEAYFFLLCFFDSLDRRLAPNPRILVVDGSSHKGRERETSF